MLSTIGSLLMTFNSLNKPNLTKLRNADLSLKVNKYISSHSKSLIMINFNFILDYRIHINNKTLKIILKSNRYILKVLQFTVSWFSIFKIFI